MQVVYQPGNQRRNDRDRYQDREHYEPSREPYQPESYEPDSYPPTPKGDYRDEPPRRDRDYRDDRPQERRDDREPSTRDYSREPARDYPRGREQERNYDDRRPEPRYERGSQDRYQSGNRPESKIVKLPTRNREPMQGVNIVTLEGFLNDPKYRNDTRTTRLGFNLVVESPVYERDESGHQRPKLDQDGYPIIRSIKFRHQAWGKIADELSRLPLGTPLRIVGTLVKWSADKKVWFTDVRVSKFTEL